jgi:hypothetical protein
MLVGLLRFKVRYKKKIELCTIDTINYRVPIRTRYKNNNTIKESPYPKISRT